MLPCILDRPQGRTGRAAEADDHHLGIVEEMGLQIVDLFPVTGDFPAEPLGQLRTDIGQMAGPEVMERFGFTAERLTEVGRAVTRGELRGRVPLPATAADHDPARRR